MQNGSGLALASNRALVVMSFGERLVAAPACVNYVSLFLSFIKFGIFRLQGTQGTGQRCTSFSGNLFRRKCFTLLAAVSYDSINTSVNFAIIATA